MTEIDEIVRRLDGNNLDGTAISREAIEHAADVLGIGEGDSEWEKVLHAARVAVCQFEEERL